MVVGDNLGELEEGIKVWAVLSSGGVGGSGGDVGFGVERICFQHVNAVGIWSGGSTSLKATKGCESGVLGDGDVVGGSCDGGSSGGAAAGTVVMGSLVVTTGRVEWLDVVPKEFRCDGGNGECGAKAVKGSVEVVLVCIFLSATTEITGWGGCGGWRRWRWRRGGRGSVDGVVKLLDVALAEEFEAVAEGGGRRSFGGSGRVRCKEEGLNDVKELPKGCCGSKEGRWGVASVWHGCGGGDGPLVDVVKDSEEVGLEVTGKVMPGVSTEGWWLWIVLHEPGEGLVPVVGMTKGGSDDVKVGLCALVATVIVLVEMFFGGVDKIRVVTSGAVMKVEGGEKVVGGWSVVVGGMAITKVMLEGTVGGIVGVGLPSTDGAAYRFKNRHGSNLRLFREGGKGVVEH